MRPILEHGFEIAPINKKYMNEFDKYINKWYKTIMNTTIRSNHTIIRMLVQFHTTFQRNNECLLGFYHRMMNSD